jgi:histone-arginine methyltransferase CARM1
MCRIADMFLQGSAAGAAAGNIFDAKTEKGSAELYFHYYGMLMHQQNMLQVKFGPGLHQHPLRSCSVSKSFCKHVQQACPANMLITSQYAGSAAAPAGNHHAAGLLSCTSSTLACISPAVHAYAAPGEASSSPGVRAPCIAMY